MILLVTNKRDITTDYVILELEQRGIPFFRLNTEDISSAKVWFGGGNVSGWTIEVSGRRLILGQISAAYYRRPGIPNVVAGIQGVGENTYCEAEWSSILRSIYTVVGSRWLNSPANIAAAEDKPRQIALAQSYGLIVPESLITNDFDAARAFVANGPTIGKPLKQALIEGDVERVIFTSRISELTEVHATAVAAAPVIYQREIFKACDIRVTVVGNRVFAAAIHSQEHVETTTDWRRGSRTDLHHEIHQLPASVEKACIGLTAALGLRFSAIDLILDRAETYWFLEANPNGQWAWIENRTNLRISRAIVEELETIRTQ